MAIITELTVTIPMSFGDSLIQRVNAKGLILGIGRGTTHGQDAASPMKAITILTDNLNPEKTTVLQLDERHM